MEQLSIRDWMILIGGMMIAAVLIDAVRRYWRERRAEIKLNARIERASPLSDDDDAFNLLTELPNGGARIVQRDDLQIDRLAAASVSEVSAADSDGTASSPREAPAPDPMPDPIDVAVAAQLAETGNTEPEEDSPPQTNPASVNASVISAPSESKAVESETDAVTAETAADPAAPKADAGGPEETVSAVRTVPREVAAESPAEAQAETASRRRTVKPAPETVEPETGEPGAPEAERAPTDDADASGTVDWLDTLEPEEPLEPDAPEHGRLPRGANTHVFILYVVAQAEEGFSGTDILETLLACDLRFGDMDFFHRHERASGRGPIEFSVANMMKPGVFDIDNMEPLQTRGLMFFVTLPGPADMLKAFDYMYETVKVVAKNLGGDIQDETRSVITRQSLEHMRQQIRELERRLLVRRN
jgi:cell division protein ZipA